MLPIVLVLLVASSALAAPSIDLSLVPINEVPQPRGGGSALADRAYGVTDNGANTVYFNIFQSYSKDLLNAKDQRSLALGLGQIIATLGANAVGIPGDACASARVVDSYVRGEGVGAAVANFLRNLITDIRNIAKLSQSPEALKYTVGTRGNCPGGGRSFSFERAWDAILGNASKGSASVLNDLYCSTKPLYNGNKVRDNNLAAAITAVSLPAVSDVLVQVVPQLQGFIAAIGTPKAEGAAGPLVNSLSRFI